jgi:hypothetical protein
MRAVKGELIMSQPYDAARQIRSRIRHIKQALNKRPAEGDRRIKLLRELRMLEAQLAEIEDNAVDEQLDDDTEDEEPEGEIIYAAAS